MPRDDTSATAVGQVLCAAREKAGMTQDELASRASMDRSYISDIERGTVSLSVDRLIKLSGALGLQASDLIGRIEKRLR